MRKIKFIAIEIEGGKKASEIFFLTAAAAALKKFNSIVI
jgi:hypothetical protein